MDLRREARWAPARRCRRQLNRRPVGARVESQVSSAVAEAEADAQSRSGGAIRQLDLLQVAIDTSHWNRPAPRHHRQTMFRADRDSHRVAGRRGWRLHARRLDG